MQISRTRAARIMSQIMIDQARSPTPSKRADPLKKSNVLAALVSNRAKALLADESESSSTIIATLAWLPIAELMGALQDKRPAAKQILLTDLLAARAAELDPSHLPSLMRAWIANSDLTVRANLIDIIAVIGNTHPREQLHGLEKQLARWRRQIPELAEQIATAQKLIAKNADSKPALPTRPLMSERTLPLTAAEREKLAATVPIDPEHVVNAKIPKDMTRVNLFEYGFAPKGYLATPKPGEIITDTGNALIPGVIDHHQLSRPTCAAALVLNRVEVLVEQHKDSLVEKLITHESPDLDAGTSVYLAMRILRDGKVPPGATALAHYVSLEDNARLTIGDSDPTLSLAALAKAIPPYSEKVFPDANKPPKPEVEEQRNQNSLAIYLRLLDYVMESGMAPDDPRLFKDADKIPADKLPEDTRRDILALQAMVRAEDEEAKKQVAAARFGEGILPRADGRGAAPVRIAIASPGGGKRLDQILREEHGVSVVVVHDKKWMWIALEPTCGASVRGLTAALEATERRLSRERGVDRLPVVNDDGELRVQPGYAVKNPWYLGGTDSFIVTPRPTVLTPEERVAVLEDVMRVRWDQGAQ